MAVLGPAVVIRVPHLPQRQVLRYSHWPHMLSEELAELGTDLVIMAELGIDGAEDEG